MHLDPEFVLLEMLPVILYWEGFTTSVHHAWRYRRAILLTAVPLVIITAAAVAVAVVAHALGLSWAAAWILGAVLAPTDASAMAAYGKALPLRLMTILRGESLINDGTALVLLAIAISAAEGTEIGVASVAGHLAWSYAGGVLVGAGVALAGLRVVRRVPDPLVLGAVSVAEPFAAAAVAESFHASGVVAVVVCALGISRPARRSVTFHGRLQVHAFWETTSWLVNGSLFVLIGLQARSVLESSVDGAAQITEFLWQGLLLVGVLVGVRAVWLFLSAWSGRLVDRRPSQRELRIPWKLRVVASWAGIRGGVSLAAALSVPLAVQGESFPYRDDILVLTFVVVGITLLVQGATLPIVIRWANLDGTEDEDGAALGQALGRLASETDAYLQKAAEQKHFAEPVLAALRRETRPDPEEAADLVRARREVLQLKRRLLAAMVDRGELEDTQMWQVQERLDLDEALLAADETLRLEHPRGQGQVRGGMNFR